jgi:hypothetical protein
VSVHVRSATHIRSATLCGRSHLSRTSLEAHHFRATHHRSRWIGALGCRFSLVGDFSRRRLGSARRLGGSLHSMLLFGRPFTTRSRCAVPEAASERSAPSFMSNMSPASATAFQICLWPYAWLYARGHVPDVAVSFDRQLVGQRGDYSRQGSPSLALRVGVRAEHREAAEGGGILRRWRSVRSLNESLPEGGTPATRLMGGSPRVCKPLTVPPNVPSIEPSGMRRPALTEGGVPARVRPHVAIVERRSA